jgi:hypothetical protein
VTTAIDDRNDEFLRVAVQAFRASMTSGASDALAALDWWHLLSDLDDDESRSAVFALFRAQGRELANSTALGGLMAQPYLGTTGGVPGSIIATIDRESPRRGRITVVVGDVTGMQLLVDRPGFGAAIVDVDDVDLRRVELPGRLELHEVDVKLATWRPMISESDARRARRSSVFLGRVALSLEILGACEGALALALEHAATREQFGKPIGSFQAVRHLLAWAATDCAALESTVMHAVALGSEAPPKYDQVTKGLAGRNGRRTCERALQVLGGIGFTAEHLHHHFHSRVLALDSLLGTSAALTAGLGAWLRELRGDPHLPSTLLLAGARR